MELIDQPRGNLEQRYITNIVVGNLFLISQVKIIRDARASDSIWNSISLKMLGAKQTMTPIFFPWYTQGTYGSLQERNSVGLFFAPREFLIKV